MDNIKTEEFDCLVNALNVYVRDLDNKANERMIETKIHFEEEDEKLAKIKSNKRIAEDLKQKLIKQWRDLLSKEGS